MHAAVALMSEHRVIKGVLPTREVAAQMAAA